jgi:hypothetical protein
LHAQQPNWYFSSQFGQNIRYLIICISSLLIPAYFVMISIGTSPRKVYVLQRGLFGQQTLSSYEKAPSAACAPRRRHPRCPAGQLERQADRAVFLSQKFLQNIFKKGVDKPPVL